MSAPTVPSLRLARRKRPLLLVALGALVGVCAVLVGLSLVGRGVLLGLSDPVYDYVPGPLPVHLFLSGAVVGGTVALLRVRFGVWSPAVLATGAIAYATVHTRWYVRNWIPDGPIERPRHPGTAFELLVGAWPAVLLGVLIAAGVEHVVRGATDDA